MLTQSYKYFLDKSILTNYVHFIYVPSETQAIIVILKEKKYQCLIYNKINILTIQFQFI